jgi:hypothetical protein
LVLEAFGVKRTGPEVRHLNGVCTDNRLRNLRWGTRLENVADQRRHGTWLYGERNPCAKLTDEEARAIETSVLQGRVLAKRHGVSEATISRIRHGIHYVKQ